MDVPGLVELACSEAGVVGVAGAVGVGVPGEAGVAGVGVTGPLAPTTLMASFWPLVHWFGNVQM